MIISPSEAFLPPTEAISRIRNCSNGNTYSSLSRISIHPPVCLSFILARSFLTHTRAYELNRIYSLRWNRHHRRDVRALDFVAIQSEIPFAPSAFYRFAH